MPVTAAGVIKRQYAPHVRRPMGQHTTRRGAAVLTGILLLAGCTGTGGDAAPRITTPPSSGPDRCAEAVTAIVEATQTYVDSFGPLEARGVPAPASPSPGTSTTPSPSPSGTGTDDANRRFQDALTTARAQLGQFGCDAAQTRPALDKGLRTVRTQGPVAGAVLRQLTATITGTSEPSPTTRKVAAGDDLLEAVAQLPAGSTIELGPGTHRVHDVVVLLSPLTIRGAGAGLTTLESDVAEYAVLDIAAGVVSLRALTLRHRGKEPANVVLAGPTASLVFTDAVLTGGVSSLDGTGGAGILMYDPDARRKRTATTLEVTGSRFVDNGSGIVLTGGHIASIAASTFTGNDQCGVCFLDASGGSVQDSTFTGNAVGVAATGTATPNVLRSTISGGRVGMQAGERSAPVVDDLQVTGSSRAALIWSGHAEGALRRVVCTGVKFGLVVGPDVAPTVRDSRCKVAPSG